MQTRKPSKWTWFFSNLFRKFLWLFFSSSISIFYGFENIKPDDFVIELTHAFGDVGIECEVFRWIKCLVSNYMYHNLPLLPVRLLIIFSVWKVQLQQSKNGLSSVSILQITYLLHITNVTKFTCPTIANLSPLENFSLLIKASHSNIFLFLMVSMRR